MLAVSEWLVFTATTIGSQLMLIAWLERQLRNGRLSR